MTKSGGKPLLKDRPASQNARITQDFRQITRASRLSPRCKRWEDTFSLFTVHTSRIVSIHGMASQQRALPVSPGLTRGFPSKCRALRARDCHRPTASVLRQRVETVREDEWAEGGEQLSRVDGWDERREEEEERRGAYARRNTPNSFLTTEREQRSTEHSPMSSSRMR